MEVRMGNALIYIPKGYGGKGLRVLHDHWAMT